MALTPTIFSSQGGVLAAAEPTPDARTSQLLAMAALNFPTEQINASGLLALSAVRKVPQMQISQTTVLAAVKGRVNDPKVRAWTFTLDGHDFYVLRLGNAETLIYDLLTQEWHVWGSGDDALWRAYYGTNWIGGRKVGAPYGSNVIVGDDGNGALYFLNPLERTDDDAVQGAAQQREFLRMLTAQHVVSTGYSAVPCFGVQVHGSIGKTPADDLTVTLEYSDDRGVSYSSAGSLLVDEGAYSFRLNWQSLGSMETPGRLFRISDYGAVQRIDGVSMEGDD